MSQFTPCPLRWPRLFHHSSPFHPVVQGLPLRHITRHDQKPRCVVKILTKNGTDGEEPDLVNVNKLNTKEYCGICSFCFYFKNSICLCIKTLHVSTQKGQHQADMYNRTVANTYIHGGRESCAQGFGGET